ncbi:Tubulin-folding cofactor B [Zancudomyces culisetae]|uniref:Tubulin-folding cofactor B n=1 Tax=Zancudomyces culisetae TaxID=1213189 RepID=A0A1R1PU88_ZANCU|nr:Tubulin-folding cofactor B [Zancudomyces culisetae]OMH84514.1 Tubulin-folding cofactor B [Zancudomyces culisetae]|eukprot:OMH83065.1 Tubulin-folding cofactor B [Zancudomyces culisetae]
MIVDFNDLDAVKKYEMPDETYEKRKDSLLSFKKQNRLGRFSTDKDTQSNEDLHFTPGTPQYEHMLTLKLDHRCQVEFQKEGELARRGTIRFLGKTDFASGAWVGVEFDEPLGRNDGSVNGIRYFTCVPSYGSFVKPEFVTCGDFPEELDFSDEEL